MTSISSRDLEAFSWTINDKLNAIPLETPESARIVATALEKIIEKQQDDTISPSLQERISDIQDLLQDPLYVGEENYEQEQLLLYRKIATDRIQEKISQLLLFTPSEVEQEAQRQKEERKQAEETQSKARSLRPPPLGAEAHTIVDRETVLKRVMQGNPFLKYQPYEIQNDPVIVREALLRYPPAFEFASSELQANFDFSLFAVQRSGRNLRFVSRDLQKNERIVLAAVENEAFAYQYADYTLQTSIEFAQKALRVNKNVFEFLPDELKMDTRIIEFYQKQLSSEKKG